MLGISCCFFFHIKKIQLFTRDTEFNYRVIQKKYATGKPDQKDLSENLAATQGLAHMIMECNKLFEVSERLKQHYSWAHNAAPFEVSMFMLIFSVLC